MWVKKNRSFLNTSSYDWTCMFLSAYSINIHYQTNRLNHLPISTSIPPAHKHTPTLLTPHTPTHILIDWITYQLIHPSIQHTNTPQHSSQQHPHTHPTHIPHVPLNLQTPTIIHPHPQKKQGHHQISNK